MRSLTKAGNLSNLFCLVGEVRRLKLFKGNASKGSLSKEAVVPRRWKGQTRKFSIKQYGLNYQDEKALVSLPYVRVKLKLTIWFESHPGQRLSLPLFGPISLPGAN